MWTDIPMNDWATGLEVGYRGENCFGRPPRVVVQLQRDLLWRGILGLGGPKGRIVVEI